ncbi:hypothetical protein HPB52_003869 [Rhipicephalus sanguineus]|uniref:Transmembrane protein n=1 Tax=Rhipicephalus sanguineus TaxID=34632 RepID=A0A9D4Q9T9_RHISA|nr:hypothetical protein HPB52_003869 [Rhipicephalus sanguineus]
MSKKLSRQGRISVATKACRTERPPAAASDFEPDGSGHSKDRDSDKASRSSDSHRAAQDTAEPPGLHRRSSSTMRVPLEPNKSEGLSSGSRRRGAARRQQRTSEVVPPYSPGNAELQTAPLVNFSATEGIVRVPQQPGERRLNSATGSTTYSATPNQGSSMSRTVTEKTAVVTSDVDKAMDVPVMPCWRRQTGGSDSRPLDEGPMRARSVACFEEEEEAINRGRFVQQSPSCSNVQEALSTTPLKRQQGGVSERTSAWRCSDVKPDGVGHSSDRDSDKASKSSDSLRAAQDAANPPRLRRRRSSTVPVPLKPNESNALSSASRRRDDVQRHQRTSKVVPPHSPGDHKPVTAPFVAVIATDGTVLVPEPPAKEGPAVPTSGVDKAMDAAVMPGGRRRTGGTDGKPLDEGPVNAPENRSAVAVTSDIAPSTSKGPASTARTPVSQTAAQPRRSTVTRATLRFTSGRGVLGSSRGMLTELQPRLEDLLQMSPKKEQLSATRPWIDGRELAGAATLMAVILALVLFALYRMYKTDGREADLCGTADCIEHVHTLGIYTDHNASPCECFGCFVCSGWSNDFRHANSSVREQAILRWFATVNKLSLGDYDQQAVINRPLSMMRQCMSSTSDGENTVRMLTAFVSERSFAWPTAGEPEEIVDYGRALHVVLELSVMWALPLWFSTYTCSRWRHRRVFSEIAPSC